jgi:proteasome lid subunit RPN8/RPN11
MRAGIGMSNTEAGFWVTGDPSSPAFTPLPFTNQSMTITGLKVPSGALALVHTHPNAGVAQPSPGDITNSNNSGLPFYVLSSRGLWLHNPGAPSSTMVRPGTTWQKPC